MRANVATLLYNDHDRVVKLLHSLDCAIWDGKVEAVLESEMYDTLTVNEMFPKLKSVEVDRGVTTRLEIPTNSHSLAPIGGLGAKSKANASSRMYSLASLIPLPDEEFDVLGEDELALMTRRFERLHENQVNIRKTSLTCFQCGKPEHFVANCPDMVENKDGYKHLSTMDNKYRSRRDHMYKHKHKDERPSRKKDGHGRKGLGKLLDYRDDMLREAKMTRTELRALLKDARNRVAELETQNLDAKLEIDSLKALPVVSDEVDYDDCSMHLTDLTALKEKHASTYEELDVLRVEVAEPKSRPALLGACSSCPFAWKF
jgi:hypothetical protein